MKITISETIDLTKYQIKLLKELKKGQIKIPFTMKTSKKEDELYTLANLGLIDVYSPFVGSNLYGYLLEKGKEALKQIEKYEQQ